MLPSPPATDQHAGFRRALLDGLRAQPKRLSSMYFYDAAGDALFQDIMRMPEYYLTDCEHAIFASQRAAILAAFGNRAFDLVELGAGDGLKTKVLLRYFLEQGIDVRYQPVDISNSALAQLTQTLAQELPNLAVEPLQGDYFDVLGRLPQSDARGRVILFLGANIGNYEAAEARRFLTLLRRRMHPGDRLLVGFDLKKDPQTILDAYNDPAGITAAFNLNVLHRANRELGADFDPAGFRHWESYDPVTGDTRSYLVSTRAQTVTLPGEAPIPFDAWEAVRVELSKKYSRADITALGEAAGFGAPRFFEEDRGYFVDVLWEK